MSAYHQPEHLDDALRLLAGAPMTVAAGCTDLFAQTEAPTLAGPVLDITRVSALRGITATDEGWRIGAATTWSDIVRSDLPPAFDMLRAAAREVGSIQIQNAGTVAGSLVAEGFEIRSQIVWAKERLVIGRGHYHWQHEPCWYAVRGKGHWSGGRKQTTLWPIPNRDQDAETVHGTQKPVECMRRPMGNNSSRGQAVYEPFCGSGTSIIAAEQIGRVCYAMEISPQYVGVILERFHEATQIEPELIDGGD